MDVPQQWHTGMAPVHPGTKPPGRGQPAAARKVYMQYGPGPLRTRPVLLGHVAVLVVLVTTPSC